jgi:hypothetical protein
MTDVWKWNDREPTFEFSQSMLNSCPDAFKAERSVLAYSLGRSHRNAYLLDALQAFNNQSSVSVMTRLVSADEQGGRFSRNEHRTQLKH